MTDRRMERGLFLANRPGSVTRLDDKTFSVLSENHLGVYRVSFAGGEGVCECRDYQVRRVACKHIYAVRFHLRGVKSLSTFFESRAKEDGQMRAELTGHYDSGHSGFSQQESGSSQSIERSSVEYPDDRISRGVRLARENEIIRMPDGSFRVPSQSEPGKYREVRFIKERWSCSCPDFQHRSLDHCQHIVAVTSKMIEKYFEGKEPIPDELKGKARTCPRCGSMNVRNNGHASNGKQLFHCRDCDNYFREPSLWKRARHDPELVSAVLDMYCNNMSLRGVSNFLWRNQGIKISPPSLWRWMVKWTRMLNDFCIELRPDLSGILHVDEIAIKVRGGIPSTHGTGQWMWLWNVIDKDTKFVLASVLTTTKTEVDGMRVLNEAKKVAKKPPDAMVHDG